MTTIEILKRAKAEVLRRGWTRFTSVNSLGEVCVMGALAFGSGEEPSDAHPFPLCCFGDSRDVFLRAVACDSVLNWNDADGRTPEDVLDAFDAAIAIAEREAAPEPAPVEPVHA